MRTRALVLACVAASCGSPSSVAVEDLASELEEAICAYGVRCGLQPDRDTCRQVTFVDRGESLAVLERDVQEGRIAYDAEAAADCLAVWEEIPCSADDSLLDGLEQRCAPVFEGSIDDGGACLEDDQCRSEHCDGCDGGGDECCTGVCRTEPPAASIGEGCAGYDACEDGAWCRVDDFESGQGECVARAAAGEPCEDFDACEDGAYCSRSFEAEEGTCVRSAGSGEPCDPDHPLWFAVCRDLTDWCDPESRTCRGRVGEGDACREGASGCLLYLRCVDGVCAPLPVEGEDCGEGEECLGDLRCEDGTCRAPPDEEPCR